jgi:hypothetical protein
MLLEIKVEIKLVKVETIPWIQLEVNKAKSKVELEVGLSIQACPLLGYAI